jgi:hypothetical protein
MVMLATAGAVTLMAILLAAGALTVNSSTAASCIPSGTDASIQAALSGPGTVADLCPGAVFSLNNTIDFTAPGQVIETEGLPADSARATLEVTGGDVSTAILGDNVPDVTVQNIQVDGEPQELGQIPDGRALPELGGSGSDTTVQDNVLEDPRGWSALA